MGDAAENAVAAMGSSSILLPKVVSTATTGMRFAVILTIVSASTAGRRPS